MTNRKSGSRGIHPFLPVRDSVTRTLDISNTLGRSLLAALVATAPQRLDVFSNVFLAVIVGKLLPHLNTPECIDKHASTDDIRFAVRLARVIDVPSKVLTGRAIDGLPAVHLKEILAPTRVFFLL